MLIPACVCFTIVSMWNSINKDERMRGLKFVLKVGVLAMDIMLYWKAVTARALLLDS
jgi:hypothetical protein